MISEVLLEVVDVDVDVDTDADVEPGVVLDVVKGASELFSDVVVEPVTTASVVVGSPANVVLISENTVAVIVLWVFGIAPATESQI